LRFGFPDDGEDFNDRFCNVIGHPNVVDSKPILRSTKTSQPLDAALAHFRRFVPKMPLKSVSNVAADARWEDPERLGRARSQADLEAHSS
jgi:hypothetical protein